MIDCSRTENYFAEKQRMIKEHKYVCKLNCADCPLNWSKNGMGIECSILEINFPEKAIAIVQKWSDEHPQKTYLSEFLKHYPNVKLCANGTPESICLQHLGLMSKDDCQKYRDCVECWNQPVRRVKLNERNII